MMRHGTARGGNYDRIPDHAHGIDGIEGPPASDVERPDQDSTSSVVLHQRFPHPRGVTREESSSSSLYVVSTVKKRKRWTVTVFLTGLFVAALVIMYRDVSRYLPAGMLPHGGSSKLTTPQHTSTIPTLLSVVDPVTQRYLYALDNPLYAQLGPVQTNLYRPPEHKRHEYSSSVYPQLHVEPLVVEYGQPLTVSWTPCLADAVDQESGDGAARMLDLTDDTILVLACDPFEERGPTILLEAAALAQAVATSRRHYSVAGLDEEQGHNRWVIPSLPVLRYESCRFQLYNTPASVNSASVAATTIGDWWLIAESPAFQPVPRPTAVHLALTHDPTEMVVNFVTASSTSSSSHVGREAASVVPIVVLVDDQDNEIRVIEGVSTTYESTDLCQGPANETAPGKFQPPGALHTVHVTDLSPNTLYRYRVGIKRNNGQGGAVESSEVYNFTSSLVRGDPQPFSYVVYGDQGCPTVGWGIGGQWTAAMAAREVGGARRADEGVNPLPIRSVHHFGDLSYARGAAHIWDEWFAMIQVFSARVPLMIGVGNHEYDHTSGGDNGKDPSGVTSPHGFMPPWGNFGDDSGGECGVPTAKRFTMPVNNASNGVFWYSHDYASVHTVVISSEHDLGVGSVQHQWLESDLASVDRTVTPWLVVETHRPLYEGEIAWDQNAVGIGMRREMEDLLRSYQVDLVLAGHYHAYHRTCDGLDKSRCNNGGPIHITIGTAGAFLDNSYIYANGWTKKVIMGEYGYGRITVHNASAMHFEFVKAGDVNDTTAGQVHDDVWIIRHR